MMTKRDGPCPCGSGKKYKNCCLRRDQREALRSEQHRGAAARAFEWLEVRHPGAIRAAIEYAFLGLLDEAERPRLSELPSELWSMFQINASEWLLAEGELEIRRQGSTIVARASELVLGPDGPLLASAQRAFLEELTRRPIRLYEVLESRPDEGLVLQDALDPGQPPLTVREKSGSRLLVQWDVFGARVVRVGDHWEMSGAFYSFGNGARDLLQRIRKSVDELRTAFPRNEVEDLNRFVSRAIMTSWLTSLTQQRPLPQVVDQGTGDPLMLVTDHYEVLDWDRLARALESQPDVEGDRKEGWTRFVHLEGGMRRSLLAINISKGKSRIEPFARTKRLAEDGRAWLEQLAGDSIRFLKRGAVDPMTTLAGGDRKAGPESVEASEPPIPTPHQTRIYQEFYRRHYRNWADQPIPILGDRTPREALKTEAGREAVIGLIKDYEASEFRRARREGRDPVRFDFLWDQVGLDRESQLTRH